MVSPAPRTADVERGLAWDTRRAAADYIDWLRAGNPR
jgi:hypothetical protein